MVDRKPLFRLSNGESSLTCILNLNQYILKKLPKQTKLLTYLLHNFFNSWGWKKKLDLTFNNIIIFRKLELLIQNFTRSVVGYSVGMYVLGVGDRHNDNIMLKYDTGQVDLVYCQLKKLKLFDQSFFFYCYFHTESKNYCIRYCSNNKLFIWFYQSTLYETILYLSDIGLSLANFHQQLIMLSMFDHLIQWLQWF